MTLTNTAHKNILSAIGNTPIVKINQIGQNLLKSKNINLFAKCEFMNPGGSIKDRIALHMINLAEQRGDIQPGATIIEATSGNTGMGLALVAASRGYKCIFIMADKQSTEKQEALRSVGAKVVICPTDVPADSPESYYSVAKKLAKETPNSYYTKQYFNLDNVDAHYNSTGPEIFKQCGLDLDYFICSIGTGGTVTGISKYLREKYVNNKLNKNINIIGVDPIGSIYFDLFHTGVSPEPKTYLTEGIGEDFMPDTMNLKCMDDIVQVSDQETFSMARKLLTHEGLLCGASSGSAVIGALKYIEQNIEKIKPNSNFLTILPDAANRYSSKHLNNQWMKEQNFDL